MHLHKKLALLLLIFTNPVYSQISQNQVESLALLEALSGGMPSSTGMVSNFEDQELREIDEEGESKRILQDYKAYDYGYTGGDSFSNPPIKKFPDQPLEYFGYDYFSSSPSGYTPLINIPVPPGYLIGPNDNIKLILYGNINNKYELTVNREGEIFVPELGPISVAGLTLNQLRETIGMSVSSQLIGTNSSVTLGALRMIDIFLVGAASNPGMYTLSALSSITDALFESGGVKTSGSLRNIKLKRNGETIANLDLYDFLINGDTTDDKRLMQGDVILIEPISKTAGIRGEVNRPAIYELKENENLNDLIKYAGNLKPKASKSNSEILRINELRSSFDLISLDLNDTSNLSFRLNDGDLLSIYPVNNKIQNAVLLRGHTLQPGFYSWQSGMVITELLGSADDMMEMTDLSYALIKRKDISTQKYSFLQIDLERAFKEIDSSQIELIDQDEIILFPSLLSPESITTKLIQDKYVFDQASQMPILEDEWTSMTYLRKSLLEDVLGENEQTALIDKSINRDVEDPDIRRYYEYSIFDYCTIPQDLAIRVVEESGFKADKSVPLEDLEQLKTPNDFLMFQQSLEREAIKDSDVNDDDLSISITNICREQLLKPLLDILKRDNFKEKLNMISIFGSVHFPGQYPLSKNMSLADAIRAAGGPKNGTYNAEIEITSYSKTGKKFTSTNKFSSIEQAEAVLLNEMDTINLKQISNEIKTVEIKGEVFFPGIYPISENQTLSELILRAGGFTEYASPRASYFQREALKNAEQERFETAQSELRRKILLSSTAGGLGQESLDGKQISQLTELVSRNANSSNNGVMGRLVIDLEGIMNGESDDIVLENGDTINIPKNKQSISVIGEVFVSNSHIFKDNLSIDDYISMSGGVTTFADKSSVYVIKSDGSILSPNQISTGFFRESSLEPGDAIVVPLQVQPFSTIKATTEITQIIYQMALAAAAVNSF